MRRFHFFIVEDIREAFAAGIRAKHIRPSDIRKAFANGILPQDIRLWHSSERQSFIMKVISQSKDYTS
jgi:hypothetical protein